jgi:hypothetical protein
VEQSTFWFGFKRLRVGTRKWTRFKARHVGWATSLLLPTLLKSHVGWATSLLLPTFLIKKWWWAKKRLCPPYMTELYPEN